MGFCIEIYKFSKKLPDSEKFGLTSQIRRAATSIPLNISEGAGTISTKEFAKFITYSYRSVNEVLTCLELIKNLNLIKDSSSVKELSQEGTSLSRMIYSFLRKLQK